MRERESVKEREREREIVTYLPVVFGNKCTVGTCCRMLSVYMVAAVWLTGRVMQGHKLKWTVSSH